METQIVYLDAEDDITSMKDRLHWIQKPRVLFVLPSEGRLLAERVDLVLLQRHAARTQIQVGLVTHDDTVMRLAKSAGIPTFNSIKAGENRRVWAKNRPQQLRPPRPLHDDDRREVYRRLKPKAMWQIWVWRYAGILTFFLVLTLLVVAAIYSLPTATITLYPETKPIEVVREIVADPLLESVDYNAGIVPGRRLIVTEEWRATVDTTGTIEVPDAPARGTVVFINRQESAVRVNAGTRVSTSTGQRIIFQTIETVTVPGALGATAEAAIVAIQPGASGNVNRELINRIEGANALMLEVRNLDSTTGGGNRLVRAVTQADHDRLNAQVLQQLQALALADMETLLTPNEFLANDSLRLRNIEQETYSHFVDEQADRLTLEIRASLQATAVEQSQSIGLVYEKLTQAVEPEFALIPGSLAFNSGKVLGVDSEGRVSFEMVGTGLMSAEFNLNPTLDTIAGQPDDIALAYLHENLPLRAYPTARVFPAWFQRMPYLPVRIRVDVVDGR
jgi:hypothetical protein